MSEFVWSQTLQLGVAAMDRDHRKIINYMNDLAKLVERGAGRTEISPAFARLCDFTRQHFAEEEQYMESIGYSRLQSHKLIHTRLLDEMDQHFRKFTATGEVGDQVFRFLTFWLKSHICGIDKQYAALVTAA